MSPSPASIGEQPGPSPASSERLFIGLMSGTSIDAVDGVLTGFDATGRPTRTLASASLPIDGALHAELTRLQCPGDSDLEAGAAVAIDLSVLYGRVVAALLTASGTEAAAVTAIGAHGQTVRHRPELGYTLQLLAPAVLAEQTGIDVVADLRSADIAAGGEGAPLVPAFHRIVFGGTAAPRAIVNIGGIANVTLLTADGDVTGHDTGPGNTLLDGWCQRHLGQPFDADGSWAATGRVSPDLLARWLAEPFFARPAPKSTGRDLFQPDWLAARSGPLLATTAPADVQATLVELTAVTIAAAITGDQTSEVYVCGGGARNALLMARLANRLAERAPKATVETTDRLGVDPQAVEATAFAWLAMRRVDRLPANLPSVTGARGERILGAVYAATR